MKKTIKMLIAAMMAVCMVLVLCACKVDAGGADVAETALEQVVNILAQVLEAAILIAGTWTLAKIGGNQKLKNTAGALDVLFELTRQTVGELQQVLVDDWKAASGKLNEEQIEYLKNELLRLVKLKLSDAVQDVLTAAGADINALIAGEAESWLNGLKKEDSSLTLSGLSGPTSI